MSRPVKIAINGFGRIGRLVLRSIAEHGRDDVVPVLINDLGDVESNARLLKYDTVHGRFPGDVEVNGDSITIKMHNGKTFGPIKVTAHRNPGDLPVQDVDVCMECTGLFRTREKVQPILDAGAKHVLVSAPGKGVEATIVYGVNNGELKPDMKVISNGSCTTNCLAPIAKVLDKEFGIKDGYMLTVHSYTGDQKTVDSFHSDPRRGRAAACNMVPTKTGAAEAVALVLPQLAGKLAGSAVRVPTPDVSFVSLDFIPSKMPASVEEVNNAIKAAIKENADNISRSLECNEEPLVSSDFIHDSHSSIFDATQTKLIGDDLVHVAGWYDNEWGFSTRMSDVAALFGKF